MKTTVLTNLALFLMLLCSAACSGEDAKEPVPEPKITIDSSIITNGLSLTSKESERSVSFTTNESWTLSLAETRSGVSWCTPSATSGGKGTFTVTFTLTENTTYDDRSVAVTLKSGATSKTFTIAQKGMEALLVTTNKYELGQEGGSIEIEVKANVSYTMEIAESAKNWITEASGRALTTHKHTLDIAFNGEVEKREGEIRFKSGDKTETVKVYQSGGEVLLLSKNECHVSDAGETISVDVRSNVEFDVRMPDVDWIVDEASTRGMSSHTLKYTVLPNETYDSRTAEIVFSDVNSDLQETLTITQSQKNAIVLSKKTFDVDHVGETIEVVLLANVDFDVQMPDVDWITQVTSRALKEHTLYFEVAENDKGKDRSATILVKNQETGLCETITVNQSKGSPKDRPYVTFTANGAQTLRTGSSVDGLEYSVNGAEWKILGTSTITFGGDKGKLQLRGKNAKGTNTSSISFGTNVAVACSGDIRTLVDYENYTTADTKEAIFYSLFKYCTQLTQAPDLPATTLAQGCYGQMFSGCTSLTKAPDLPATTLTEKCYYAMFFNCTSLTVAPVLPATTLALGCYSRMFNDCTSLTKAPDLPATTLALACYTRMFSGCTGLTVAPVLPATTLAQSCYYAMFARCTSLTAAPDLPATTLALDCYNGMFLNCTSLTKAPVLPATTLAELCYRDMFYGCSSLSSITLLATDISAGGCLDDWVKGVPETGTFVKAKGMNSLPEGRSGIPVGWTVQDYEEE